MSIYLSSINFCHKSKFWSFILQAKNFYRMPDDLVNVNQTKDKFFQLPWRLFVTYQEIRCSEWLTRSRFNGWWTIDQHVFILWRIQRQRDRADKASLGNMRARVLICTPASTQSVHFSCFVRLSRSYTITYRPAILINTSLNFYNPIVLLGRLTI